MENKEVINTLSEIRNMMERSTKVLSLSGVSAVVIGFLAIVAAVVANNILENDWLHVYKVRSLIVIAISLFIICFMTIIFFSKRKAEKNGLRFKFDRTVQKMLWNFFLPLIIGGVLCVGLIYQGHYGLTSSFMLIFYGLALVNLSNFTFSNIKYLGYVQLVLGLVDFLMIHHSLLFWMIGFGVCHVVYGIIFYLMYERKKKKEEC